ncbi:MAG: leucine-rich repeat domain-containing protein [Candidatus Poribacteria bacterium]|nr:leucine-rich repeat domain-containing protein [Candidatus Poribacteria bacterium]
MEVFTWTESARTPFLSQNSGITHIFILTLIACVLLLTPHQIAIARTVHIPDPNLRAVLELALGKDVSADITQVELANLESLEAIGSGIRNLTGLEFATNLTKLHLGLNEISDLSPLKGLKNLIELDLHRNRKISDVSPLKNLTNLRHLSLRGNIISDLSPLKDLATLTFLHIGYNNISDLSALKDLTTLTFLNLDDNRISDLSPLKDLPNLTELHLDDNNISDTTPLKDLTTLTFLNINDNRISDLSPLTNLTDLTSINLHGNDISDVSLLKDLINLRVLRLHENQISDLSALRDLTNLRVLTLHDNQISDLSALKDLTNLTKLDLHRNKISDVSSLKGLINLTILDLSDNQISDFSPLVGLIGNLEKYDSSNQTTPLIKSEDVNRDGVVDVTDLVLVSLNYRNPDFADYANFDIYPDINGDGIVDVSDLVAVAAQINPDAAAPTLNEDPAVKAHLSIKKLIQWIRLAKLLNIQEPYLQKGITVLEQFLVTLTFLEALPKETALLANYPNPFNPETWIPYQLAKPAAVNISIHSADGNLVRTLSLGQLPTGVYHNKSRAAHWDGRNQYGESVASGVYFYTLTAGDFAATRKMIILK